MNSIRRQLSRELLTVTLLLVGSGLAVLYLAAREAAVEQYDFALKTKALAVSTITFSEAEGVRLEFSDRFFQGFEDRKPRDFFELWSADGTMIARSESLGTRSQLPMRVGTQEHPERWNLPLPTGRPGRAIGFAFKPKARSQSLRGHEPMLRLVVASDRTELDETLWELLSIVAGCTVLLVGTMLWVVPRVLARGLHSLAILGEQASAIDARSLGSRFATDTMPLELRPISSRLNDLLGRLESSFERERRFSADLAHELRTPLAELRSQAECALKWPQSRDSATDRETLAIAEQMERLVGHILALARAEEGQIALSLEAIVLEPFLRGVWKPYSDRAEERGLRVSFVASPLACIADRGLLRSVLANLFDNAVDYTAPGGSITVLAKADPGRIIISVANDAPDISASDVQKLFDRFWRKETSRTGGKHVGLGLALARAFAEAMNWTLEVSIDHQMIVFTATGQAATPAA